MTKIEQLEKALSQKIIELAISLNTQHLLHQTLESNNKRLDEVTNQLKIIAADMKYSNEYIQTLKKDNQSLKLSCDVWMRRAIQLEFKVLSERDGTKR